MNSEQLIEEGRKLQRPCVFLDPYGNGPVAAVWYKRDDDEIESTGHHCWITVDAQQIPGLPPSITGYLSVFTDEENSLRGRVEMTSSWPKRSGTKLYAHSVSVLPPIDAVFLRGSEAVGQWLGALDWERTCPWNSNFKDREPVSGYDEVWEREDPDFRDHKPYAVLGGWHRFDCGGNGDWHELIDEQLMILTIRDSEPWVEAWRMRTGQFKVIERIT